MVKLMHQPQWSTFRHGRCFGVVSVQMWVMFEVPQGMLLAGTLDVSVKSMLRHSQRFEVPQGVSLAGTIDVSVRALL